MHPGRGSIMETQANEQTIIQFLSKEINILYELIWLLQYFQIKCE